MKARSYIRLRTKLAAALCQLVRYDEAQAEFVRIIPHEEAKKLSEQEILSRFDFHHDPIPKSFEGADVHWNLTPLPKDEHRTITNTIDIPRIAKSKRITRANDAAVNRLLARDRGERKPASKWPKRKMQSRRRFDGSIVHASRER